MGTTLSFTSLFVYSEEKQKCFYTTFGNAVNIIHGRNTSGKSTLFQSILYTIGINDGQVYLRDILDDSLIFRLDCIVEKNKKKQPVIFIRNNETLFIKVGNCPIERFNGISANQSKEHVKLKEFVDDLFGFSLKLESKDEYKAAPVEAMWLPYYISQAVGWVYLRKSFSNLDFFRNFKSDYNDYYFGIIQNIDREEKQRWEKKLKEETEQLLSLEQVEKKDSSIQLTKLSDEYFLNMSNEYLLEHAKAIDQLKKNENQYVLKCNELKYYEQRLVVLSKVSKNHKQQNPLLGRCPTCSQSLSFSVSESYIFLQDENDTDSSLKIARTKIKSIQSDINSLSEKIKKQKEDIARRYATLNQHFNRELTYDSWLDGKANVKLLNNINNKIGELHTSISKIKEELANFQSDEEIEKERRKKDREFADIFNIYLSQLSVKPIIEDRHTQVYQISSFPSQGVELHKTVMAYHFAFNKLIKSSPHVHRFPFMLDAIFKEDIEVVNKGIILQFINKNRPVDTQLIFSVADSIEDPIAVQSINKTYFNGQAKMINIGSSVNERAFLSSDQSDYTSLIEETFSIIYGDDLQINN